MIRVLRYVCGVLAFALGTYMIVDASHAFLHGSYITPSSGPYAGQLGPWAGVVRAMHIDPLSMRWAFLILGVAWIVHSFFIGLDRRSKRATITLAVLSLWYVPAGTIVGLIEIVAVLANRPERNV